MSPSHDFQSGGTGKGSFANDAGTPWIAAAKKKPPRLGRDGAAHETESDRVCPNDSQMDQTDRRRDKNGWIRKPKSEGEKADEQNCRPGISVIGIFFVSKRQECARNKEVK